MISMNFEVDNYANSCGKKEETISTSKPMIKIVMVFVEHPFHSLRIMPQILENTTLSAISMQNERVVSVADSVRNPLPKDNPKN